MSTPGFELAGRAQIFVAQAAESGKPANIAEKMAEGRLGKWREEVVLEDQVFLIAGQDDKKQTVKQVLKAAGNTLGAPVKVTGFVRVKLGDAGAAEADADADAAAAAAASAAT